MQRLQERAPWLVLLASAGSLGGALTAQFGFGLRPCILCLYQRGPYVVAGLLALLTLVLRLPHRARSWVLALCALAFFVNAGIAVFHTGVERKWWEGTAACVGGQPDVTSLEDLQAQLSGPPPARCDEIPWALFGLSMANYNIPASLALGLFSAWAALGLRRKEEA